MEYWKIKKDCTKHYNTTANIYNYLYGEEQKRKFKAVLEIINKTEEGYILDVGCGTGLFIKEIPDFGGLIVGVDCSRNMIQKAKHERKDREVFLCADADNLPFLDRSFDKIFTFTLLQNMPNPSKTLKEICRVANTGSQVIITATKKVFTKTSFFCLIKKEKLSIVNLLDEEDLKDHIAICKKW